MDSHGQSEVAFAFCHLLGTVRLMACLKRIKYEIAKVAISATQFAALMDGLELTRTRAKLW